MQHDEKYRLAKRRVLQRKGFYVHLATYVGVMTLLFVIDFLDGGKWWFYWPLLGWGIGVAFHALSVFGIAGVWGTEWEERKIREVMRKMDEGK
jgi:2TM domain